MTLLMACVLMAGWMRSMTDQDAVFIHHKRNAFVDNHVLISTRGALSWSRWSPIDTDVPMTWKYRHAKVPDSAEDWNGADIHWRWKWNGFEFCSSSFKETKWMGQAKPWTREVEVWQIPYGSVTVLMTLISHWLLLSKPRISTRKKTDEPIPEKMA